MLSKICVDVSAYLVIGLTTTYICSSGISVWLRLIDIGNVVVKGLLNLIKVM